MTRDSGQERVEVEFAVSAATYDERRRQERVLEWLNYHQRRMASLEVTLADLIQRHQRERDRYRAMLTTEGDE